VTARFSCFCPAVNTGIAYFDDVEVIKLSGNPNLILNPGFETAGAGGADVFGTWTETAGDGAIADETTLVHGGAHACKLTGGATPPYYPQVYHTITVVPGQTYQLTFWTRGDGTNAGRYLVYDTNNVVSITGTLTTGVAGTTYTLVSKTFTAPAGCVSARVILVCPAVNGGIAYFDDVEVVAIDSPISIWKG
jgi:hypothetical protein